MSHYKEVKFNRTEVEFHTHGARAGVMFAHARSPQGSGWQVPIRDMTPNDLRKLADMMEEHGVPSDQYGGDFQCR